MRDLLGCTVPIQQAPMGAISGARLASAVARAGGIGTLSATGLTPSEVVTLLDSVALPGPGGAIAVNFTGEGIDPDAVAAAAAQVRLVDFFWADPDPAMVRIVHSAGAMAGWQVGSADEAVMAVDAGCDVVTVQGVEAGGHVRGTSGLLRLLGETLRRVDVPLMAAGGITAARDVTTVMAAGAAGARVGTRFVATAESAAHPAYKQALVRAGSGSTVVTDAFADCPLCRTSPRARVLSGAVAALDESGGDSRPGWGRPPTEDMPGPVDAMALYAGAGVRRLSRVLTAAEVVALLGPSDRSGR